MSDTLPHEHNIFRGGPDGPPLCSLKGEPAVFFSSAGDTIIVTVAVGARSKSLKRQGVLGVEASLGYGSPALQGIFIYSRLLFFSL